MQKARALRYPCPHAANGIIEVIDGKRSLEETVWRDPKTDPYSCRLSGEDPCSTLAPLVDVRVTSPLVDCFILVVEWGRTKIDIAQHALHTAPNIYENLIGVVLNKTDIKSMARYDGNRSEYYRNTHYARYGLSNSD